MCIYTDIDKAENSTEEIINNKQLRNYKVYYNWT